MSNRRRRANGEGTVCRRASDGRWVGMLTVGSDARGKPRRLAVYGRTQREVAEKLARLRTRAADGMLVDAGKLRLAEFLERWLEDSARPSVNLACIRHRGESQINLRRRTATISCAGRLQRHH